MRRPDWYLWFLFRLGSNLVFEGFGHAAIWLGLVVSIPSLNWTPVMTLAR